jgi:cytidylate kinase
VWLDASPDERRRRRAAERGAEAGETALERDRLDAAQMLVPEDSVRVDTEGRSIDEVIESIVRLVEERA